jgi:hypothetical protein
VEFFWAEDARRKKAQVGGDPCPGLPAPVKVPALLAPHPANTLYLVPEQKTTPCSGDGGVGGLFLSRRVVDGGCVFESGR